MRIKNSCRAMNFTGICRVKTSRNNLWFCTFLVMNSFSSKSADEVLDSPDEGATISCTCGKENMKKHINLAHVADILENIVKSNLSSSSILYYPDIIREHFLKCSMCKISISRCMGRLSSGRYMCKENEAEFIIYKNEIVYPEYRDMLKYAVNNITSYLANYDGSPAIHIGKRDIVEYPIYDHIPIGGLNITRVKRQDAECIYPTSLQTADLTCIHYPSKVSCLQKCAFGYTLKEGTKLHYKCKTSKNKWNPHKFEECQPYVDCTIALVTSGRAKCSTPTLTHGPICDVKCYKYEDKPAVHSKEHRCDKEGKWHPRLPFCAFPGTGIYLVPRPKTMELEDY